LLISGNNGILSAWKRKKQAENKVALLFIGGGIAMLFITLGIITLTVSGGEK